MIQPLDLYVRPALRLLPARMDTPEAEAMLLAICAQESGWRHRRQMGGPARGWPQFEISGVRGVLEHPASRDMAASVCAMLAYPTNDYPRLMEAIEHNDLLSVALARLALWRLPEPLAGPDDADEAWRQYLEAWRPGKPRPEKWVELYAEAWECVRFRQDSPD